MLIDYKTMQRRGEIGYADTCVCAYACAAYFPLCNGTEKKRVSRLHSINHLVINARSVQRCIGLQATAFHGID